MVTSNAPAGARQRRLRRSRAARRFARIAAVSLVVGCGGSDRASLHRDVRLEIAHDPPLVAPADAPFILGLSVKADPPLPPGSAHLWYDGGGGWVRSQLEPAVGTDRMEASVPGFPRGRMVRYYFTVRNALGESVRLPAGRRAVRADTTASGAGATGEPRATAGSTGSVAVPDSLASTREASSASEGVAGAAAAPRGDPAAGGEDDVYRLLVRAPVSDWAKWLRGGGAALALLLVVAGAALAFRWRPAEPPGYPGGVTLEVAGIAVFALALAGAACASFQATGNPLRDVATGWWVAGAAWLPIVAVARALRRSGGGSAARARRLAVIAAILAVPGAVALLVGLAPSI
jgi:hypothetical protein